MKSDLITIKTGPSHWRFNFLRSDLRHTIKRILSELCGEFYGSEWKNKMRSTRKTLKEWPKNAWRMPRSNSLRKKSPPCLRIRNDSLIIPEKSLNNSCKTVKRGPTLHTEKNDSIMRKQYLRILKRFSIFPEESPKNYRENLQSTRILKALSR